MAGIFDTVASDLFVPYTVRLRFRDRVVGGTPSNPKLIEGWLRAKMGVTQEQEVRNLTIETLRDLGVSDEVFENPEEITFETLQVASEALAAKSNTTMFKRDAHGLYLESRIVKAMLKECVAILYPGGTGGNKWGATGGGPKNKLAEWVFVNPEHISLGVTAPSGVDLSIGHISGPQGPRSTLDYYEYVEQAEVTFEVMTLQDRVQKDHWPAIWRYAQENGLGAKRSQGYGRFDVLAWDRRNGTS